MQADSQKVGKEGMLMDVKKEHNQRVLIQIDGKDKIFNLEEFVRRYKNLGSKRGKKKKFQNIVMERTGKSESAVKAWTSGINGPDNIEDVRTIAKCMDILIDVLLKDKLLNTNKKEYHKMREIKDSERNAARNLYESMCRMIHTAEIAPEFDDEDMRLLKSAKATVRRNDNQPQFGSQEDYREYLLFEARKARFDLPRKVRDEVIELIGRTFGPFDLDSPHFGEMYFRGDEYKEYLQTNGMKDDLETRYLYASIFAEKLRDQLDEIFADYLIGEDD